MNVSVNQDAAAATPVSEDLLRGIWRENPVFVQVLGLCPALAVSNTARNALAMGLATLFVVTSSNAVIASLRRFIPKQVRIATFTLVIATFVTIVDYVIQSVSLEVHRALGAFVYLIVVNCVILGRAEAFASKNPVGRAALDGLGTGIGFTAALLSMGAFREVLGNGSLLGIDLFPGSFEPWVVMTLPSGGFFTLAVGLLSLNYFQQRAAVEHCTVEAGR